MDSQESVATVEAAPTLIECLCGCHYPTPGKVMMHFAPCCQGVCRHCRKWFVSGLRSHRTAEGERMVCAPPAEGQFGKGGRKTVSV